MRPGQEAPGVWSARHRRHRGGAGRGARREHLQRADYDRLRRGPRLRAPRRYRARQADARDGQHHRRQQAQRQSAAVRPRLRQRHDPRHPVYRRRHEGRVRRGLDDHEQLRCDVGDGARHQRVPQRGGVHAEHHPHDPGQPDDPTRLLQPAVRRQGPRPEHGRHPERDRGGHRLSHVAERRRLRQRAHVERPAVELDPAVSELRRQHRVLAGQLRSDDGHLRAHAAADQHALHGHR